MADRMQDDAMQRFRQMYSKAPYEKSSEADEPPKKSDNSNIPPALKSEENVEQNDSLHSEQKQGITKSDSVLDIFMRDKEKSLIILLIVILLSEKADTTLILALMYLVI